jgi:hypothetical protein
MPRPKSREREEGPTAHSIGSTKGLFRQGVLGFEKWITSSGDAIVCSFARSAAVADCDIPPKYSQSALKRPIYNTSPK